MQIVAKYADACNLFGSPKTVRRILSNLSEHCKKANWDYDTILRTKLTHIIIADDQKEVEKRFNERFVGLEEEAREDFAIYGTPKKVLDQILLYEEIGIDYLIVNFDSKREMESLKIFANKIIRNA